MSTETELQEAKDLICRFINEYRYALITGFCTFDGKQWDCDEQSKGNIIGANLIAILNGGVFPENFMWRDHNNNDWEVSPTYMAQLAGTIAVFYKECFYASWIHKENVLNLTTVEDVLNYDYTHTLWPDPTV